MNYFVSRKKITFNMRFQTEIVIRKKKHWNRSSGWNRLNSAFIRKQRVFSLRNVGITGITKNTANLEIKRDWLMITEVVRDWLIFLRCISHLDIALITLMIKK